MYFCQIMVIHGMLILKNVALTYLEMEAAITLTGHVHKHNESGQFHGDNN